MSADNVVDLLVTAAETTVVAVETLQQAKAESKAAKSNAAIADANAALELANAEAARKKALYDANVKREENERLSSRQRALYAKAGVDIDSGTPLLVLAEQARDMEEDARNIELQGEVGYEQGVAKSNIWKRTSASYMSSARDAERLGNTGAASGILKTVSKINSIF